MNVNNTDIYIYYQQEEVLINNNNIIIIIIISLEPAPRVNRVRRTTRNRFLVKYDFLIFFCAKRQVMFDFSSNVR